MSDTPCDTTSDDGVVVRNVSHAYRRGVRVLDDVSLHVAPGSIHCLLGASGCGKTTLLRIIAGLERSHHGDVWIGGQHVAGQAPFLQPEKRSIGFVFQDYALFPHLNARQNVCFGMSHTPRGERTRGADELLTRVGLKGFEQSMPHTLSGGQQQRVALARALARKPAVMLLDEPFSGLDAALRQQVRESTVSVLRAAGIATLLVTHDPREALAVADRITILDGGKVMRAGTPGELADVLAGVE